MKKNITKNLAGNRFIITFAVLNIQTKAVSIYRQSNREAFFYALSARKYIGSVPPRVTCNECATAFVVCWTTAKAEPIFYFSQPSNYQAKYFFKMSNKKMNFVCRVRYTLQARTARATKCQNFHFKRLFNLVPCHVVAGQKIVCLCN